LAAAGLLAFPFVREARIRRAAQPLTEAWRRLPVAPRQSTLLGISFRPPQVDAFDLDARPTFQALLAYPFQIVRLGAYWNRIEPAPGRFDPRDLDWQVEDAARAGMQIILAVGALKCFGYPEFYVPAHRLERPLPEGVLIPPDAHPALLAAATEFVARIVERYK